MELEGSVAIVSGAADGIGRAFVDALVEQGASVTAFDIDPGVETLRDTYPADRVWALAADITRRADIEAVVAGTAERFGGVGILVNNAAAWKRTPVDSPWAAAVADWDEIMNPNLLGLTLLSRAVVPHLRTAGAGHILNLSTYYVLPARSRGTNQPDTDLYNASKWALNGFTDAWSKSLARHHVQVNGLCMGATDTAMLRGLFADGQLPAALGDVFSARQMADFGIEILASDRTGENFGAWVGHTPSLEPIPEPHQRITGIVP